MTKFKPWTWIKTVTDPTNLTNTERAILMLLLGFALGAAVSKLLHMM